MGDIDFYQMSLSQSELTILHVSIIYVLTITDCLLNDWTDTRPLTEILAIQHFLKFEHVERAITLQ